MADNSAIESSSANLLAAIIERFAGNYKTTIAGALGAAATATSYLDPSIFGKWAPLAVAVGVVVSLTAAALGKDK